MDQDCPVDENGDQWKCLPDGTCQLAACVNDIDCCAPGITACPASCVQGECVGTLCDVGEEVPCFNACHKGLVTCNKGIWSACDAPPQLDVEVCGDGIDNDCFGGVDDGCAVCQLNQEQPCSTSCDTGKQICQADGQWGPCSASNDCNCSQGDIKSEPCGNCGHKDLTCSGNGTWNNSEICLDEGDCNPGETEEVQCGKCGVQIRTCQDGCLWGPLSEECTGVGSCDPGETMDQGCTPPGGGCGSQLMTCSTACEWEAGSCVSGAGCQEGDMQSISCGEKCGEEISVCNANCNWVSSGTCQELGECVPGSVQIEVCGQCGEKSRTCSDLCQWQAWLACDGSADCEPGAQESQFCGPVPAIYPCSSGTQTRSCNENCLWNGWQACVGAVYPGEEVCGNGIDEDCSGADYVIFDDYETNNTCNDCHWLGTDPDVTIYPTTHDPYDVDYFCFQADDSTTLFGSETIYVKLSGQTSGMDNDLYLFKGYTACESDTFGSALMASVSFGSGDEVLTWTETSDGDDGVYIIAVKPYEDGNCFSPYTLKVNGLN